MLSIEALTVRYGRLTVLDALSLEMASGRVHGLVGRNGAGKTTLLDTLYGFVRPDAGRVRFDGRPIRAADVGFLTAESFFYPGITGREYLRVFRAAHPAFDVEAWGRVFQLPLERRIEAYSTGMRKKLAFLGVLSLDRPVLMLDEPSNGLDLETNQLLGRLLRELAAAGKTVLLTSHVLEELATTCDAIHVLDGGRIAGSYGPADFPTLAARLFTAESEQRLAEMRGLLGRGDPAGS